MLAPFVIFTYFRSWIEQLLHYPRYATPWPIDRCDETQGCESFLLPGGLEGVILATSPFLNVSLLDATLPSHAQSIRVHNAPGIALMFETFLQPASFDNGTDCTTLLVADDGIQICGKQVGDSMIFGMSLVSLLDFYTLVLRTDNRHRLASLPRRRV